MKLIKNKRGWKKFLRDEVMMYDSQIEREPEPKEYPCFGYDQIHSFGMEELTPLYLYAADLERMQRQLATAASKIAMKGESQ